MRGVLQVVEPDDDPEEEEEPLEDDGGVEDAAGVAASLAVAFVSLFAPDDDSLVLSVGGFILLE